VQEVFGFVERNLSGAQRRMPLAEKGVGEFSVTDVNLIEVVGAVRDSIRKHKKLSAVSSFICLVAGFVMWEELGGLRGQLVARLDVARGHYTLLEVGLPVSFRPEYNRLLRERYGIETRVVAGCVVSQCFADYVGNYNTVSMRAANRRFGRDIFTECTNDANRIWRARKAALR
jgi:hypothetical protein